MSLAEFLESWLERFIGVYERPFFCWLDADGYQHDMENLPEFTDGEIEHQNLVDP